MDDNARRRQHEAPIGATSNPRYAVNDPNAQRRSYGASAPDRYRPAPINTSPTAARGLGGTAAYSGYYQEPAAAFSTAMSQSTMAYQQPDYGQDSRQPQSFGGYNPSMMYTTGAQNAVYDTSQQFPSRQPAALPMMPTDVAAPYFPTEPTNAAAASGLQPQAGSSSSTQVYQQSPADQQRAMLQNYPGGMTSMSGMAQTQASAPEQVVEEQDYSASAEMGEAYEQYQSALKEIFTNIRSGVLQSASESLLNVSEWLLSKVVELGLAGDNPALHPDRIKLWHDFNHAWLALFQRQKDIMESGQPPQRGQTLISEDILKKMGKEIIRLCDGIERHGLVDYEYGVWEEQIIDIIGQCIDLYENGDGASARGSSLASAAGSSQRPLHHMSR
ncbi:Uu.00g086840.m01.CDS01 [Anthostomella pinea]|uniref:Uu.00g086840.m01.CDS01 n=1 Tax=Anthostomella pinea TaxID=933095 RepID=A0AAI8VMA8_9PEZI|nr:Uu.00g086840.m01.CDS01 [Anthostomella pinea]